MNNASSPAPIPGRPAAPRRPSDAANGADYARPEPLAPRVPAQPAHPELPATASAGGHDGEVMYNRVNRVPQVPSTETNSPSGPKESQMEKLPQNIQEAFLNAARKERTFLTIYLMSGVKLSGRIRSFDKYSVVLESNNQEQLIFKHAISTVVVAKPAHHTSAPHHSSSAPGVPGQVVGVSAGDASEN